MPKDFLLNDDLDLMVTNGELAIGESTAQNQKLLILATKGEFKFRPMRGVGSRLYLEEGSPDNLAREIRQEFSADGMTVKSIKVNSDLNVQVQAFYKD